MATKAVQQFMLGTVLGSEGEARQTLAAMKEAGYDGIELCGFMIHPIGFAVKMLTKAAGMPVGKGGNLDWHKLVRDTGLQVVSLHTYTCPRGGVLRHTTTDRDGKRTYRSTPEQCRS